MSTDTELKGRLSAIARDGFRVTDEAEIWPLTLRMLDQLGSPDPELRDGLIYKTLARWAEWYLDAEQLREVLAIATDRSHLTLGLGERETDSVFMRAFSSLVVAVCVDQHRARPYLDAARVREVHSALVACLSGERDERGWVSGKGWADAVSHAADALDELAQCPELDEAGLRETLLVVRETVLRAAAVFPGEEDERLATAVLSAARRGLLAREDVSDWIAGFERAVAATAADGEAPAPDYRGWFWLRTNVKRFLRTLFFRARYEGATEWFEPALETTLRRISESRFRSPPDGQPQS